MSDEGMQFVGFKCRPELARDIDAARGVQSRSQFLRTAILAALKERGFVVSEFDASAADRKGKGGPKKKKRYDVSYRGPLPAGEWAMNDGGFSSEMRRIDRETRALEDKLRAEGKRGPGPSGGPPGVRKRPGKGRRGGGGGVSGGGSGTGGT